MGTKKSIQKKINYTKKPQGAKLDIYKPIPYYGGKLEDYLDNIKEVVKKSQDSSVALPSFNRAVKEYNRTGDIEELSHNITRMKDGFNFTEKQEDIIIKNRQNIDKEAKPKRKSNIGKKFEEEIDKIMDEIKKEEKQRRKEDKEIKKLIKQQKGRLSKAQFKKLIDVEKKEKKAKRKGKIDPDVYCGAQKVPRGRREGTQAECKNKYQIRRWGLKKVE